MYTIHVSKAAKLTFMCSHRTVRRDDEYQWVQYLEEKVGVRANRRVIKITKMVYHNCEKKIINDICLHVVLKCHPTLSCAINPNYGTIFLPLPKNSYHINILFKLNNWIHSREFDTKLKSQKTRPPWLGSSIPAVWCASLVPFVLDYVQKATGTNTSEKVVSLKQSSYSDILKVMKFPAFELSFRNPKTEQNCWIVPEFISLNSGRLRTNELKFWFHWRTFLPLQFCWFPWKCLFFFLFLIHPSNPIEHFCLHLCAKAESLYLTSLVTVTSLSG